MARQKTTPKCFHLIVNVQKIRAYYLLSKRLVIVGVIINPCMLKQLVSEVFESSVIVHVCAFRSVVSSPGLEVYILRMMIAISCSSKLYGNVILCLQFVACRLLSSHQHTILFNYPHSQISILEAFFTIWLHYTNFSSWSHFHSLTAFATIINVPHHWCSS